MAQYMAAQYFSKSPSPAMERRPKVFCKPSSHELDAQYAHSRSLRRDRGSAAPREKNEKWVKCVKNTRHETRTRRIEPRRAIVAFLSLGEKNEISFSWREKKRDRRDRWGDLGAALSRGMILSWPCC